MKRKNAISALLIFFLLSALFLNIAIISLNNQFNEDNKYFKEKENLEINFNPKTANGLKPLNYSNIHQNTSIIYRGFLQDFRSINFTVNASGFGEDVTSMKIQIFFPDNTNETHDMDHITGTDNNYTYTYTPAYDALLGFHEVRFEIYNNSGRLNTGTTVSNFTVKSNCFIDPIKSEYHRGETLRTSLTVINEPPLYNFKWNVTVVDSVNESTQKNIFNVGNDLLYINLKINETYEQTNKYYYIKVNMTDKNDNYKRKAVAYFQFKVILPESILIPSSIDFNPSSVFRTRTCSLTLNVSAQDNGLSIGLINVTFLLKDPNTATIINNQKLDLNGDGTFSTSFSVDASRPAGIYTYIITTLYNSDDIEEYSGTLNIKNNLPEIDGYEINGYENDERISVNYGEDLEFTFDVFDIEGVAYVTLLLINEEGDEYEITREYEDDLEITVRTAELITGTWDIYVTVIDTDGASVDLEDDFDTAPQKITVIPDTFGEIFSWIMLIIGLIIGVLLGTGISYHFLKLKKLKPEKKIEEKETKPKKEKIPKKGKPAPIKRKPEEKLIKEEKPEKKEPKAPRKIKRKLK
ncbi:MAG: hypothetical protein ACFFAH_10340 [Promethearchaeota archaeon]